ncbi:hypothetical protein [Streptomyces sp. NPDC056358]
MIAMLVVVSSNDEPQSHEGRAPRGVRAVVAQGTLVGVMRRSYRFFRLR